MLGPRASLGGSSPRPSLASPGDSWEVKVFIKLKLAQPQPPPSPAWRRGKSSSERPGAHTLRLHFRLPGPPRAFGAPARGLTRSCPVERAVSSRGPPASTLRENAQSPLPHPSHPHSSRCLPGTSWRERREGLTGTTPPAPEWRRDPQVGGRGLRVLEGRSEWDRTP